jgi:micrococcal nuclease
MRFTGAALGATITVATVAAGCGSEPSGAASSTSVPTVVEANAIVERIVDGDTIDVLIDGDPERVRLTGIDTPEITHRPSGDRPGNDAECFADEAHAYTASLLPIGTPVRLERDVVGRDDYGRLLAYVHRADDGVFVNYEIVRQGYARPLTIAPNVAHGELMVQAARDAERDDAGLWSACR